MNPELKEEEEEEESSLGLNITVSEVLVHS